MPAYCLGHTGTFVLYKSKWSHLYLELEQGVLLFESILVTKQLQVILYNKSY